MRGNCALGASATALSTRVAPGERTTESRAGGDGALHAREHDTMLGACATRCSACAIEPYRDRVVQWLSALCCALFELLFMDTIHMRLLIPVFSPVG